MVDKEPINYETTLIEKDEVWYTIDTNKPYSGKVFSLHENGEKREEGIFKDGTIDGKWIEYYENGQKRSVNNYKNGERDGKWTHWHKNGHIKYEEYYEDTTRDDKWTHWHELIRKTQMDITRMRN